MTQREMYRFIKTGKRLWGHEKGRRVRAEVEAELETLSEGSVLVLDLKGVEVMDFSFAGEVFGKLYSRLGMEHPGRALILRGLSDYVRVNLQAALASLGLVALAVNGTHQWELIGKAGDTDCETLEAVQRLREATAPELADALSIKLTTCNQRLKKLTDAGAILRTRFTASSGGEQYLYRWPL
jgi:hypothetical protein